MNPKYFLAYLTANDDPYFQFDYFNLLNMYRYDPGVEQVHLYIAVSSVQKFTQLQKRLLGAMLRKADNCRWLTCEAVILKSNIGRDFSSLQECLLAMKDKVSPDDFILVRNRSSRGPYMSQWYRKYIDVITTHENIGLVGSTINLNDHYTRGRTENAAHVQSYAFLSRWKYLSSLLPDFPGINAISHFDAILDGEIELSQRMLTKGAKITSLQKPEMILDIQNQNDPVQSAYVPRLSFKEIPIIHSKRQKRSIPNLIRKLAYVNIARLLIRKNAAFQFTNKTDNQA